VSVAVISIHDVAPATHAECEHLLAHVEELDAPASLLVVPGPWRGRQLGDDARFVAWLHAAQSRGHEIVAHGWEHRGVVDPTARPHLGKRLGERVLTRGCAEFATLGSAEAERRAASSLTALRSHGFEPTGFVAPGWSLSTAARDAVRAVGFEYTTTRLAVDDLTVPNSIAVPAVCHRPGSPLSMLAARMVVAVVEMRCRDRRSIRLALHPDDVHDERLDQATRRALQALRSCELDLVTYDELVRSCRTTRAAA
jgi:predicted deacetylase